MKFNLETINKYIKLTGLANKYSVKRNLLRKLDLPTSKILIFIVLSVSCPNSGLESRQGNSIELIVSNALIRI